MELEDIVSASGWVGVKSGLPSGEMNAELSPYRARGIYPRPGRYDLMPRADSTQAGALRRQMLTLASLNWDILAPQSDNAPATEEEKVQTQWVRDGWDDLEGGFINSAVVRPASSNQYGFSCSEIVLDIDETTGWWKLAGLHWFPAWSVDEWVLDQHGFCLGVTLLDERNRRRFIRRGKFYHDAVEFYGRNYEGISLLRSLWYPFQHRRQVLVDDLFARERASAGIPVATPPEGVDRESFGSEYTQAETILGNIATGDGGYAVKPRAGWEFEVMYLNSMPDNYPILGYLDHLTNTQLSDNLSELGNHKHGSRNVGTEMRLDRWSQMNGLCAIKAHGIDFQIHRQIYDANGWNVKRMCRTSVSGLHSPELYQRLLSFMTVPIPEGGGIIPATGEITDQLIRNFGLARA